MSLNRRTATGLPFVAAMILGVSFAMGAPLEIDTVNTTTIAGASTNRGLVGGADPANVTYTGDQHRLDGFTVGATTYTSIRQGQVVVRRNTDAYTFPTPNPTQVTTWTYRLSDDMAPTPTVTVAGEYYNTFDARLSANDLWTGGENTFYNDGAGGLNSNVERVDFIFDTAINITADHAFALFERGGGGGGANVGFKIAAITGISGLDATAYTDPFHVQDSDYNSSKGLTPDDLYDTYRYDVDFGPELDHRSESAGSQHVVGVAISATDVVTLGTLIYGYSIMSQDVTATTGADLLDWDNDTYFPTNTQGAGDVDMASIGAQLFTSAVPEPSSFILVLGGAVMFLLRRSRAAQ